MNIYLVTRAKTYTFAEDEFVIIKGFAYVLSNDLKVDLENLGIMQYSMEYGYHVFSVDPHLVNSYKEDILNKVKRYA